MPAYSNPRNPMSQKAQKRAYRRAFTSELIPDPDFVFRCGPCAKTIQPHACAGSPDGPPGAECRCSLCWRQVALVQAAKYVNSNNQQQIRIWLKALLAIQVQAELKARAMKVTRQMRAPARGRCARCGKPVEVRRELARGDHGPFCGPACKARAWRERKKAAAIPTANAGISASAIANGATSAATISAVPTANVAAVGTAAVDADTMAMACAAPGGMLHRRLQAQDAVNRSEPVQDRFNGSGWVSIGPEAYDGLSAAPGASAAPSAPSAPASAAPPPADDRPIWMRLRDEANGISRVPQV